MINASYRLKNVVRVFEPYSKRDGFVRLDRNEDPIGYDKDFFNKWLETITPHDVAAYKDSTALLSKIANWHKLAINNIYISSGSDALIKNIFEVYIDRGQNIILQNPSWRMYEVYASIYGANVIHVKYDKNLHFKFDNILTAINNFNIRMIILANPNQPTGTLIANEQLITLLELAHKKDVLVVIDEAYYLFSKSTILRAINDYDNIIVVHTFSKAFGLAGLRIGYCMANAQRIKELMLLRPVTDSNSLALKFAEHILDNLEYVTNKINDYISGRDYLYAQLRKLNIDAKPSNSNFIIICCNSITDAELMLKEIRSKGYLLKGPFNFEPLQKCIRVTIGSLTLMQQLWKDCADIFKKYSNRSC